MPEAMKKIRNELGQDAVILNSKIVHRGGLFGFFTKKNIEVIAAIDPEVQQKRVYHQKKEKDANIGMSPKVKPVVSSIVTEKKPIVNQTQKNASQNQLLEQLQEMKEMVRNLSSPKEDIVDIPPSLKEVNSLLVDQEVSPHLRQRFIRYLFEDMTTNKEQNSTKQLTAKLAVYIGSLLEGFCFGGITYKKKYINVVGPTGVGKTTTLAKLAAEAILKNQKKVAFITTDTYRIAAIEQLKTYAKILNIPIEVAYTIDDFKQAKDKFSSYDLILIDTAGRNYRNRQFVDDLKEIIDFDNEMESYLVLSLTSKERDMEAIFQQFSIINIDQFIFTKLDETSQYGSMLNMMLKHNIGTAYLTNGQNVPDDINVADPHVIANTVLGVEEQ